MSNVANTHRGGGDGDGDGDGERRVGGGDAEGGNVVAGGRQTYCVDLDDVLAAHGRIGSSVHRTPVLTCRSIDRMAAAAAVVAQRRESEEEEGDGECDAGRMAPGGDGDGDECDGGIRLFFKVEAMQRTGSFKFRGALNAVLSLLEDERERQTGGDGDGGGGGGGEVIRVVTHSSGNHAQAVALAARVASSSSTHPKLSVGATIVMPRGAPAVKLDAVRGYGGHVVLVDDTNEAREDEAERISEETGAHFVHPSEDPRVVAGQGTVSVELVDQVREMLAATTTTLEKIDDGGYCDGGGGVSNGQASSSPQPQPPLDAVIIPVGGGGLASGNAVALRGLLGDRVKIILAEPEVLDDAKRSREAGTLLGHDPSNKLNSVADGLKTTLGPNTWPIVRDLADDVITVSEREILAATKLVWERMKVCIEPSAGVGVAVALGEEFARKFGGGGGVRNVGVVLCGGNVDVVRTARLMDATCGGGGADE